MLCCEPEMIKVTEEFKVKLEQNSVLPVIDIQQSDFTGLKKENFDDPAWDCIRKAKRVPDVFRAKKLPVIQVKEVHRADMVDFGRTSRPIPSGTHSLRGVLKAVCAPKPYRKSWGIIRWK